MFLPKPIVMKPLSSASRVRPSRETSVALGTVRRVVPRLVTSGASVDEQQDPDGKPLLVPAAFVAELVLLRVVRPRPSVTRPG